VGEIKCLEHFPKDLSPDIKKYADDEVFKDSRYIFTRKQGKQQYGYCTYCRTEFKTEGLRHKANKIEKHPLGDEYTCPNCKSTCTVKASGISRSYMVDKAYFVYYEKSLINPNAIIARGIYAVRDYSNDYHNVETKYFEQAWYLFEMGNSVMMSRHAYYTYDGRMEGWHQSNNQTVFSLYSRHKNGCFGQEINIVTDCSLESIAMAVKYTPFQYSTWKDYNSYDDMVKFFDLYAKYPCIEYLTKLGLNKVVEDKLIGRRNYSAVHWQGKTLLKVLRLEKKEINDIRAADMVIDSLFLKLLQISKKDGSNLSLKEIKDIHQYAHYYDELQKMLKRTTLRKIHSFISKQYKKHNIDKRYSSEMQVLTTWRDYINDCTTLQLDLTMESILFPPNLHKAHQNTNKQIKLKANKIFNRKISKRAKSLNKYCFEDSGLMIRPAASSLELIEEGIALNHCVGRYAESYANGRTDIFVIRKTSEPDKPYFTVEIIKERVEQVKGNKNSRATEDVDLFMKKFEEEKLGKKKIQVRVSA
jgi:hypothetical protein